MKPILRYTLLLAIIICFTTCKKDTNDSNGLPLTTQDGKNTFGFLLNGQAWTPQGSIGITKLSLYYDATFSGGVFNLSAYRIINSTGGIRQQLVMFGDSIQVAQKIILPNKNKFGFIFSNDVSGCDYELTDTSLKFISGYFNITKLDKTNGIFAGEFELKFKKSGCEDVEMTQGRFDLKF